MKTPASDDEELEIKPCRAPGSLLRTQEELQAQQPEPSQLNLQRELLKKFVRPLPRWKRPGSFWPCSRRSIFSGVLHLECVLRF